MSRNRFASRLPDVVEVQQKAIADLPVVDEGILTAGSPTVTIDLNTPLGRNATWFEVLIDGPGDLKIEYSVNGSSFSDPVTRKQQETWPLEDISVHSVRLTRVSADTSYRFVGV